MTAALLLQDVYEFVQQCYKLIFLPGLNTETNPQHGLPFRLDLNKKKKIFVFEIEEKATVYLNKT